MTPRILVRGAVIALGAAGTGLAGCARGPESSLAPHSPQAEVIAGLWWTMFWMGSATYGLVLLALLVAVVRSRKRRKPGTAPPTFLIWAGGVVLPAAVVGVLTVLSFIATREASPAGNPGRGALQIEVVGHKFWWEVRYPDEGIVTANEITIPAGRPVDLVMESADVIHSMWIPRLHGKVDMVPGRITRLQLQADEPGIYPGRCAEYCGTQHAGMAISVEALEPEAYQDWVDDRRSAVAPAPGVAAGQEVFMTTGCAECHAVEGTEARGTLGPDLTHLMSRRTLGAGRVPNNRGFLGGWVVDPQGIKPGNLMPPTALEAQQLIDLLDYLETLE